MKQSFLILVLLSLALSLLAQDSKRINLLKKQIEQYGQAEIEFSNPGRIELTSIAREISVSNVTFKTVMATVSIRNLEYMASFPLDYKIIEPKSAIKAVSSALSVEEAMNWDKYPTWQQYDTIMHKFAADYPDICRLDTIGLSVNGKAVMVLKISDNVNIDEAETEVFYTSTMHGDELAGYVLMLRLANHLLENASNGSLEQQLIDSLEIWINPLANPDGTYYQNDTINSPRRYNVNNIDLNRNFPDPTVTNPPLAHENVDMIEFLKERNFTLSANFHSGAEVLNFPWDRGEALWDGRIHADSSWFFSICKRYADTVHLYSTPGSYLTDLFSAESYPGVTRGDDWYEVNGSRQDYVNYERACREVTMEISASKQSPASDLPILWDYNKRSLLKYLSEAFYGIHGKVRDNDSELPLEAMITVTSHDRDSSQVFSDSLNGYFSRPIDEGSWDLKISAPGYHTAYISNVTTEEYEQRFLDIRLSKDTSVIPIVRPNNLLIWPVPASEYINIKLPPGFGTDLNITIVSSSGKVVYIKEHILFGEYLDNIPVRNFAAGLYVVKVRNKAGETISRNIIVR